MQGEYEYYIKGGFEGAVKILTALKDAPESKNYATKALSEIYKRRGMVTQEQKLLRQINSEEIEDPIED
jgi:hypothetical protein